VPAYLDNGHMARDKISRPSFAPRNWPGWLGVLILIFISWLPRRAGLWLVAPIGPLLYRIATRRREVAERNLERCFPELDDAQRTDIVKGCFNSLGRMIAETAWCWSPFTRRIGRISTLHGLEYLLEAEERGRGVLLLTSHNTCIEIGGHIVSHNAQVSGIYRPLGNAVLEWYQTSSRLKYAEQMISKRDARAALRLLRNGGVIWYAPDQDFGAAQSEFAPFFGISTATLLATHKFPKMTGCAVVPMFPRYDRERKHYDVYISPALEDFPSGNPAADLARINEVMEEQARKAPDQYWWIHRRFKTRPEGEPPFYD
jgi:KDO2-lipid IV(A) lauroyltransferase